MQSVAGFTYVYFGEDFCSGVPFSHATADSLIFGEPQTTEEIFNAALAKFDSALAHPGLAVDLTARSRTWRWWGARGRCSTSVGSTRRPRPHRACRPSSNT